MKKKTSWHPKTVNVDLRTYLVKNPGPTKRNHVGLKKGTGGVVSPVAEAIEEIEKYDLPDASSEGDETAVEPRIVSGAHLVYRRMQDVGAIEELWLYKIDKLDPTKHISVEEAILDATDVSPKTHSSEDGNQRAYTWVAGNAKFMHITGLN